MANLFSLLQNSTDYRLQEKFLTDMVKKELLTDEYFKDNLETEIENIFIRTKDNAKRLHLLADYIKVEYAQYRNDDIQDEIFKIAEKLRITPREKSKVIDEHLANMINDLSEWIYVAGCLVDCFEIAKALIKKYNKLRKNKSSAKAA